MSPFFLLVFLVIHLIHAKPFNSQKDRYLVILNNVSSGGLSASDLNSPFTQKIDMSLLKGYVAQLDSAAVERLKKAPGIAYIEKDQVLKATDIQSDAPWGLAAISNKKRPQPAPSRSTFNFNPQDGTNVVVYVVDSGIDITHPEFEGRASEGPNLSTSAVSSDIYNHGTHVAATIAGKTFGIAKNATVVSVKILADDGQSMASTAILALDWVVKQHVNRGQKAASIVNMSISGPLSKALNTAVDNVVKAGIIVVTSAGNERKDACQYSPASSSQVIAVAASGQSLLINGWRDLFASFSNYGKCVDMIAPGVDILSAKAGGTRQTLSGTSMAAPHVSGVAAVWLSRSLWQTNIGTPSQFKSLMTKFSLKKIVLFDTTLIPKKHLTKNVFLQNW